MYNKIDFLFNVCKKWTYLRIDLYYHYCNTVIE